MNKRQAKKGIIPHGSWRGIRKARYWLSFLPAPRWRKKAKWLFKIEGEE